MALRNASILPCYADRALRVPAGSKWERRFPCIDGLKSFPLEQTFDNMRLMYYGFKGYTKFFFDTFPGFYLTPKRVCTNSTLIKVSLGA